MQRITLQTRTLVCLAMVLAGIACQCVAHAQGASAAYDVALRPLGRIAPGTVIGDTAPDRWSLLVIKSQPRLGAGDLDKVGELVKSLASFLSVTVLANVERDPRSPTPQYYLKDVAVGLGTRIADREVIISTDTQAKLGASLGIIARSVLSNTEKELVAVNQLARSRTMLVFDVPSIALAEGKHRPMALRHAILVDARNGRSATLVWLINQDDDGKYTEMIGKMNWVPVNTVEDRVLSVDANEFVVGIPSSKAFAILRIPPGAPLNPPRELRQLAAMQRFSAESAQQLEVGLRDLLYAAGPPSAARTTGTTAPRAAVRNR